MDTNWDFFIVQLVTALLILSLFLGIRTTP